MKRVIVAGHVCLDLTPAWDAAPAIDAGRLIGVGPLALSPGGCVGNTGPALAGLGIPTELFADVGSDELGRVLVDLLAASGAGTAGIARVDGQVTSYSVVVDFPGRDRTFWHHIGANAAFDGSGVAAAVAGPRGGAGTAGAGPAGPADADEAPILHLGYSTHLPALYANAGAALVRLVEAAGAAGSLVSMDMAELAPHSEARQIDWERLLRAALPAVDVMKASVDDMVAMMPAHAGLAAAEWADLLVRLGAAVALVTAGPAGLHVRTGSGARIGSAAASLRASGEWPDRQIFVPTLATEVVATTAAGDFAAAGFVAALARDLGPADAALLSAATAATRISGRPAGRAYELAAAFAPDGSSSFPGGEWRLGADRVFHGPLDRAS